ncbi:BRO family protein [Alcanivorax sp.]|jgi:hypothetical protein|uniref:BRO-N domain-containing protein n=1 Tax=Alcanivorax sp. TaxID=1872427 RepID=UPI0032D92E6F
MTTKPSLFHFNSHPVRVVERAGLVWFVASDVSGALEYQSAKDLARNLDEDEKGRHRVPTLGGDQTFTVINESGLYHAILKSRKPAAKAFRKWVTAEVLPAIRRGETVSTPGLRQGGQGLPVGQRYLVRAGDAQLVPLPEAAQVVDPESEAALGGLVAGMTVDQRKALLSICIERLCGLASMPVNMPVLLHWKPGGQVEFRFLVGQRTMDTQALHGSLNLLELLRDQMNEAQATADAVNDILESWEVRNGGNPA